MSEFNAADYGITWTTEPAEIVKEALREYVGGVLGADVAVLAAHDAETLARVQPSREAVALVAVAHVPVLDGTHTGLVVGCQCLDRVFVRGQETWAEHIADAVLALLPGRTEAEVKAEALEQLKPFVTVLTHDNGYRASAIPLASVLEVMNHV